MKSLDRKLSAIHADPQGCAEFIIADAKDADMAFGIPAPGRPARSVEDDPSSAPPPYRTLEEYREQIRQVVRQGLVDIVLMSASTAEQLVQREKLFEGSHVTPAGRANDATDVHAMRGSSVPSEPAAPFRSASLDHLQCGELACTPENRHLGVDLGLYSVTFNNDLTLDAATLTAFKAFREECEAKGFRYFLEVFNPNAPHNLSAEQVPAFINDVIARTLAGVTSKGRPVFLKIVYQGPWAMEELVRYDPHLVVGILGGSAGTTRDAFQLIHDAQRHGAKVALFGRKINTAENQLAFIEFLRLITNGVLTPEEAVGAYHAVLAELGVRPHRTLAEDQQLTTNLDSYADSGQQPKTISVPSAPVETSSASPESSAPPVSAADDASPNDASPNFASMSSEERLAYFQKRLREDAS